MKTLWMILSENLADFGYKHLHKGMCIWTEIWWELVWWTNACYVTWPFIQFMKCTKNWDRLRRKNVNLSSLEIQKIYQYDSLLRIRHIHPLIEYPLDYIYIYIIYIINIYMPTLKYKRASLVAAMQGTQETWVQSLDQEGNGNTVLYSCQKNPKTEIKRISLEMPCSVSCSLLCSTATS